MYVRPSNYLKLEIQLITSDSRRGAHSTQHLFTCKLHMDPYSSEFPLLEVNLFLGLKTTLLMLMNSNIYFS